MAVETISLVVPASGLGAEVDSSLLSAEKTLVFQGSVRGVIKVEIAAAPGSPFCQIASFTESGQQQVRAIGARMRVRVNGEAASGTVDIAADQATLGSASLAVPAASGIGASSSLDAFAGEEYTLTVQPGFTGILDFEISNDGVDWAVFRSFSRPGGCITVNLPASFARVRRKGVTIGGITPAVTIAGLMTSGPTTDPDAIHRNIAGEIIAITEKLTPVGADVVLIEDSGDANNKKRVALSNLIASEANDPNAIHVNVAGEIVGITEKTALSPSDVLVLEDSDDSNNKKRVQAVNLSTARGYFAARVPGNQTTNLAVGDHIEFATSASRGSKISLSTGVGQANGIFTVEPGLWKVSTAVRMLFSSGQEAQVRLQTDPGNANILTIDGRIVESLVSAFSLVSNFSFNPAALGIIEVLSTTDMKMRIEFLSGGTITQVQGFAHTYMLFEEV